MQTVSPSSISPSVTSAARSPVHVAVHGGLALVKGKRGDRPGGIVADAAQRAQLLRRFGKLAAEALDDLLRRFFQIARAGVVAKPLPELHQLIVVDLGERGDIGKGGQKPLVIGDHSLDARLLEHDLRDPDVIGRGGIPPGERPAHGGVPVRNARQGCGKYFLIRHRFILSPVFLIIPFPFFCGKRGSVLL